MHIWSCIIRESFVKINVHVTNMKQQESAAQHLSFALSITKCSALVNISENESKNEK